MGLLLVMAMVSVVSAQTPNGGGSPMVPNAGGGGAVPGVSGQILFNSGGAIGADAGLAYVSPGQLSITPSTANTTPLTISGGSLTGSATTPIGISLTGTGNSSGAFKGSLFFMNYTDTSHGAAATFFEIQRAGVQQFAVQAAGGILIGTTIVSTSSLTLGASSTFGWTGRGFLTSPAAGAVQFGISSDEGI